MTKESKTITDLKNLLFERAIIVQERDALTKHLKGLEGKLFTMLLKVKLLDAFTINWKHIEKHFKII